MFVKIGRKQRMQQAEPRWFSAVFMPPTLKKLVGHYCFWFVACITLMPSVTLNRAYYGLEISYMDSLWKNS